MNKMNTIKLIIPIIALAFVLAGCSTTPKISPAIVQQGVSTLVSYSAARYTNTVPALRVAASVICAAANSTNIAPAQIISAIESSDWTALKSDEAVLILNSILGFYIIAYDSYGADAVNKYPEILPYAQAVCAGLDQGLAGVVPRGVATWPLVRFK